MRRWSPADGGPNHHCDGDILAGEGPQWIEMAARMGSETDLSDYSRHSTRHRVGTQVDIHAAQRASSGRAGRTGSCGHSATALPVAARCG